jgi:hypothetical protein
LHGQGSGVSTDKKKQIITREFLLSLRITDILEERGWSRTKDRNVTNFTIKWCLEHQVDWIKFEEGKQLINNIPGQITFADKVNLWNTMRDYIHQRRLNDSVNIHTFLPMTFVLDDESEVAEFLRTYKSKCSMKCFREN